MKKIQFLLFMVLLTQASFAQPYQSYFGNPVTKWYVQCEIWDWKSTYILEVADNNYTMIDDSAYRKVFWYYPEYFDPDYYSYVREDSETGKLYLRNPITDFNQDDTEYLVSDMSLEVGDKFRFPGWCYFINDRWSNIEEDAEGYYTLVDSVYYQQDAGDEQARKHIRMQLKFDYFNGEAQLEFIEEIGPNSGFYHYLRPREYILGANLSCYETEAGLWKNRVYLTRYSSQERDCIQQFGGINSVRQELPIHIKQSESALEVSFENPVTGKLILYDAAGKIQLELNLLNNKAIKVPVGNLSVGNYILYVKDNNTGKVTAKKAPVY